MLLASIKATEAIWPSFGLLPSLLGKFLVVCLIDNSSLAGVSPAPKQGPQNASLNMAPVETISAIAPSFAKAL